MVKRILKILTCVTAGLVCCYMAWCILFAAILGICADYELNHSELEENP